MRRSRTCYWCGDPATSDDHVPPENLFPKDRKKNLITVPSCRRHNEDLSKEDEIFRFYLQAVSESPHSLRLFEDKTLRSITRPGAEKLAAKIFAESRPVQVGGKETRALKVDSKRQNLYFEKIIRGLFFHIFGRTIQSQVVTISRHFIVQDLNYDQVESYILKYLSHPDAKEGQVGQPEIFSYRYFHDLKPDGEAFLVRLTFYGHVNFLGMFSHKKSELAT